MSYLIERYLDYLQEGSFCGMISRLPQFGSQEVEADDEEADKQQKKPFEWSKNLQESDSGKWKWTPEDLQDFDSVGAIIRNQKDEILMMDHVKLDFWTIPIGKVKKGETIIQGLKTEIKEELDISITKFEEISTFVRQYSRGGHVVKATGHLFDILMYNGTIKNKEPHKHRSLKWMKLKDIKRLPRTSDMTKEMLKKL